MLMGRINLISGLLVRPKGPNCFRDAKIHGLENVGAVWRYNPKAWNNNIIMREYLHWLNGHINGRSILLLMDNFIAHELAVKILMDEGK